MERGVCEGLTVVEDDCARRACQLLDELDGLGVVLFLDDLVVLERRVLRWVAEVLEPGGVEGDCVFLAADVLYLDLMRNHLPIALTSAGRGVGIDVDVWR